MGHGKYECTAASCVGAGYQLVYVVIQIYATKFLTSHATTHVREFYHLFICM